MKRRANLVLVIVMALGLLVLCRSAWAMKGSGTQEDPYVITNAEELQDMQNDLGAYYVLGNDIDASETQNWNSGEGFEPVETFVGTFDGKGHIITGLYIDRSPDYGVGLFGLVGSAGTVENVGLVDNYMNGRMAVGALAGQSEGFISNCYATGTVTGEADSGGLVGYTNKIVTRCYSSGSVTVGGRVGGFTSVGGLIGLTRGPYSVIYDCYSTADVTSTSAKYQTGGFIGINKDTVYNCYSTGRVTAASGSYSGGFCSLNQRSITNCYWDKQTSGKSSSSGGTGKTTAEMMQQATFANWDFIDVWDIVENESYPFLRCFAYIPLEVAVDIKPGSCPNPVNMNSHGALPVAILGSEDLDVNAIVATSVRLVDVAPVRHAYEDVSAPVLDANDCNCVTDGPDGYLDLTLKFKTPQIVEGLGEVNDGDILTLALTGVLSDKTPIEGADCIRVINNVPKALAAKKSDINGDGIVNITDFSILSKYWLESTIF